MKPQRQDALLSLFGTKGTGFTEEDGIITAWDSDNPQPTEAEIEAEVKRLQTEYDANQYQRDRQYPELGEQLDMLFHDMTAGKGSKDGEWYKAIAKVKADNPKEGE